MSFINTVQSVSHNKFGGYFEVFLLDVDLLLLKLWRGVCCCYFTSKLDAQVTKEQMWKSWTCWWNKNCLSQLDLQFFFTSEPFHGKHLRKHQRKVFILNIHDTFFPLCHPRHDELDLIYFILTEYIRGLKHHIVYGITSRATPTLPKSHIKRGKFCIECLL